MDSTAPAALPERTIRDTVLVAGRKLGMRRLAARAGVDHRVLVDVLRGGFAHDAPALRRLLAEAEAVVGNQARTDG
jgi:hypothetical protein